MDQDILEKRQSLNEKAKAAHPEGWSGEIRDGHLDDEVGLNPERSKTEINEDKQSS
jgi:putative transposase